MKDDRLGRLQPQLETHLGRRQAQVEGRQEGGGGRLAVGGELPVLEPDPQRLGSGSGQPLGAAAEALEGMKDAAGGVGHGEVGHVELTGRPRRLAAYRLRGEGRAEEGRLIAEVAPGGGLEVAGEVPPLGAEVGMGPVVGREAEGPGLEGACEARILAGAERAGDAEPGAGRPLLLAGGSAGEDGGKAEDQDERAVESTAAGHHIPLRAAAGGTRDMRQAG